MRKTILNSREYASVHESFQYVKKIVKNQKYDMPRSCFVSYIYVYKTQGQSLKDTCEGIHFLRESAMDSFIGTLQEFFSCLIQHLRYYQEFWNSYF